MAILTTVSNPVPQHLTNLILLDWVQNNAPSDINFGVSMDTFTIWAFTFSNTADLISVPLYVPTLNFYDINGTQQAAFDIGGNFTSASATASGCVGADFFNTSIDSYNSNQVSVMVSSSFYSQSAAQQMIFKVAAPSAFMYGISWPMRLSVSASIIKFQQASYSSLVAGTYVFTLLKILGEQSPGWMGS